MLKIIPFFGSVQNPHDLAQVFFMNIKNSEVFAQKPPDFQSAQSVSSSLQGLGVGFDVGFSVLVLISSAIGKY